MATDIKTTTFSTTTLQAPADIPAPAPQNTIMLSGPCERLTKLGPIKSMIFHRAGPMTEKAAFLGPTSWYSLVEKTYNMPLLDLMG